MRLPNEEEAAAFAIMLKAGLPPEDAIVYFYDGNDPTEMLEMLRKWRSCKAVRGATLKLMRKPWQNLSLEERISYALDQHYSQLAYLLFSSHFGSLVGVDIQKANTARVALEAKLAGTAGKLDALSQFAEDIRTGKLKLGSAGKDRPASPDDPLSGGLPN